MFLRAPYSNPNVDNELDWNNEEEKRGISRKMIGLFMQDIMNKEQGKLAPDTTGACLRRFGYPEDYAYMCMQNNMGIRMQMARTLALLRTLNPKKEYTSEEV